MPSPPSGQPNGCPTDSRQPSPPVPLPAYRLADFACHRHCGPPPFHWRGHRPLLSSLSIGIGSGQFSFPYPSSLVSTLGPYPFGGFGLTRRAKEIRRDINITSAFSCSLTDAFLVRRGLGRNSIRRLRRTCLQEAECAQQREPGWYQDAKDIHVDQGQGEQEATDTDRQPREKAEESQNSGEGIRTEIIRCKRRR